MSADHLNDTVTADDVAELAGVSRWTVNRAFKKDASISEKSRKKVLEAAEKLGYTPDLLAASLASDRSNLVALLVDDFLNPHKLVMMERLSRVLRLNGWDTMLVNTLDENDASAAMLHASQRRVDAVVLIGVKFDEKALAAALGAHRVDKLILFARRSDNPNTISICCDDGSAMDSITDHVIEKGYRRPVFLAGPQTESAHLLRMETFVSRWRSAFGETPECRVVGVYDPKRSYDHVKDYIAGLGKDRRPDILVCENDALAMGAIDALRFEHGLRTPDDIAVTGFDDVPMASNPNYQLTTYRQPLTAMAEGLVDVLKGETERADLVDFAGELVVRGST